MDDLRALASDLRELAGRLRCAPHQGCSHKTLDSMQRMAGRLDALAESDGSDRRSTGVAMAEHAMRCTQKALSCGIYAQVQLVELLAEILRYELDRPIGVEMTTGGLRFVLNDNAVYVRAMLTMDWSGEHEHPTRPTWVWHADGSDLIQRELTHREMAAAVLAFVTGDQRYEWDALYKRVPRADR